MNVDVYNDAFIDVGNVMQEWFGVIGDETIIDMAKLFFFVILIMFIFCLLSLPFRKK